MKKTASAAICKTPSIRQCTCMLRMCGIWRAAHLEGSRSLTHATIVFIDCVQRGPQKVQHHSLGCARCNDRQQSLECWCEEGKDQPKHRRALFNLERENSLAQHPIRVACKWPPQQVSSFLQSFIKFSRWQLMHMPNQRTNSTVMALYGSRGLVV